MAKILITGSTGFVGRHLCSELIKRRHEVVITARRNETYSDFPVKLENVISIIWPYGINDNITKGFDVVIHLANSPETKDYWKAHEANVLSTELICKASEKSKSNLIYISSQSANEGVDSIYASNKRA